MDSCHKSRSWTVLGGWAVPPSVLYPVFGKDSVYIDINPLMPAFFRNGSILPDWKEILLSLITPQVKKPIFIAGWSTGAILSLALSSLLMPEMMVLLSSTPSFCRRDNFRHGTRKPVLQSMRASLETDRENVLKSFYSRCGLDDFVPSVTYTLDELATGLRFLEEVYFSDEDLQYLSNLTSSKLIFHGTRDLIVPFEAGKYLSSKVKGVFFEYEGTHSFFRTFSKEISSVIANG